MHLNSIDKSNRAFTIAVWRGYDMILVSMGLSNGEDKIWREALDRFLEDAD